MREGEPVNIQEPTGQEMHPILESSIKSEFENQHGMKLLYIELRHLLFRLKEPIERGDYQYIIGEDTSARIPTLIVNRVLKQLYQERNHPTPYTLFLQLITSILLIEKKNMTLW
ncbi:MAG: hypothetical protein AB1352_02075 [Patescibacteria group bacterium]